MMQLTKSGIALVGFACFCLCVKLASAQENPFGGAPTTTTTTTPEDAEKKPAAQAFDADPDVRAIQQLNPQTPDELLFTVRSLMLLRRTDVAKTYLEKFSGLTMDEATLDQLHKKYGATFLLRLGQSPDLQPAGRQLAESIQRAAFAVATNRARLEGLVGQLSSENQDQRIVALAELRRADSYATGPLLAALFDGSREGEQARILEALVVLGADVTAPPLTAAMTATDPAVRTAAARALGALHSGRAVASLLAPALASGEAPELQAAARDAVQSILGRVPSLEDAQGYLRSRVTLMLDPRPSGPVDGNNDAEIWIWDADQRMVLAQRVPAKDADFLEASRLADSLARLAPTSEEFRVLSLAMRLEAEKRLKGLDQELSQGEGSVFQAAADAGIATLQGVLSYALKNHLSGAAAGVVQVLGEVGSAELVQSDNAQPTPLVAVLQHPDRRLRYAAARAIVKLDPDQRYAGSSYLPEVLGYFAASSGQRRVLIGDPNLGQARSLAGTYSELGFAADTATTGRQLIQLAQRESDYQFILISDRIDRPNLSETIQQLHKIPITAGLPIGVMSQPENLEQARLEMATANVLLFTRPTLAEDLEYETQRLLAILGRDQVSAYERLDQARFALETMAKFAAEPARYGFYNLVRQQQEISKAILTPDLASPAAKVLGLLGTPHAQATLMELASEHAAPISLREVAAQAFATAIEQHGLQLTRAQILQAYDRYNASESLTKETQQILSSLLDAMESNTRNKTAGK